MAPKQPPPVQDFNAFLNADRQRKKNQDLAQKIFGKDRRASAPGGGAKPSIGGSLASRVGVQKRTGTTPRASPRPSAGNVNSEWTHDLHSLNNAPPARNTQAPPRGPRAGRNNDRLRNALSSSASSPALHTQFNIVGSSNSKTSLSIRGAAGAGPYAVIVRNLATGTTVADIREAFAPMGGVMVSCVIIAEKPKVIAEMLFETKEGADNVVDTFNNQNADGNVLHVYHKEGAISSKHSTQAKTAVQPAPVRSVTPLASQSIARSDEYNRPSSDFRGGNDRYVPRQRSRERGQRDRDYDRGGVTDGSFGFDDRMDTDNNNQGGLYSDNLISRGRGGGRGNSRERGRGDRGRGYNR